MGAITVITSGKGGVGKSTVAANLGAALARRGRRVLVLDADAGLRSLDAMLGISDELVFDLSDIVFSRCSPMQAIYPCRSCAGLFVLPAPLDAGNVVLPEVMRSLVQELSRFFDHVLIDSPAGLGHGFVSAVAPASRALVVCNTDPVCLRDSQKVRRRLIQCGIEQIRLVINRFSCSFFQKTGSFVDLDELIDASGIQLIGIIPEEIKLPIYAFKGRALSSRCLAAEAFNRLALRMEGEQVPLMDISKF